MPCAAFLCAAGSLLLDFPVHFIPLSGAETNKTMSGKLCRNLPGIYPVMSYMCSLVVV